MRRTQLKRYGQRRIRSRGVPALPVSEYSPTKTGSIETQWALTNPDLRSRPVRGRQRPPERRNFREYPAKGKMVSSPRTDQRGLTGPDSPARSTCAHRVAFWAPSNRSVRSAAALGAIGVEPSRAFSARAAAPGKRGAPRAVFYAIQGHRRCHRAQLTCLSALARR